MTKRDTLRCIYSPLSSSILAHLNLLTLEVVNACTLEQEKGRMATDLKRLKQHFKAYEPTLKELKRKYQVRAYPTQSTSTSTKCYFDRV